MPANSTDNLSSIYVPLRLVYGLVPIVAGADKFFNLLTDWGKYLPSTVAERLPVSAATFMSAVGIIEIVAGLAVLTVFTRLGAYIVAIWLLLISANLVIAGYYDVAVRDAVMAVGAYTLGQVGGDAEKVGSGIIRCLQEQPCMESLTRNTIAATASTDVHSEPISDEDVVARVLGGDAASFELIMRRYNRRLFRVSRSILGDEAEAEDVVQEAYMRAFKHLDQFEGRSRFSTWLTKIAVYEATARRRKLRRLRLADENELELSSVQHHSDRRDASDMASQRELTQVLADAVESLPDDLRVVFTLRLIEQLDTNETAECLELSPANVKVRLHRARLQLQSWIDRRIGQEARRLYAFDGERCDRIVQRVMSRIQNS